MNDAEIKAKSDEIVRLCLVKWKIKNDDERILKFKEELPYFIQEFDDSSMPMIDNLLQRFDYFSHENVNKRLVELYNRISEDYDLDPMLTAYSTVKSATGRINSSNDYISDFKILNGISKNFVFTDVDTVARRDEWIYFDTVVLIDDICGSGNTLKRFLKERYDIFKDKRIIYVVICAMGKAITRIEQFASKNGFNAFVECSVKIDKAFENSEFKCRKDEFIRLSQNLDIYNQDILGYEHSESLVAYYNNTPNNTLGVFRKVTSKNHAIFPRHDDAKINIDEMKKAREKRKRNNYKNRMVSYSD